MTNSGRSRCGRQRPASFVIGGLGRLNRENELWGFALSTMRDIVKFRLRGLKRPFLSDSVRCSQGTHGNAKDERAGFCCRRFRSSAYGFYLDRSSAGLNRPPGSLDFMDVKEPDA